MTARRGLLAAPVLLGVAALVVACSTTVAGTGSGSGVASPLTPTGTDASTSGPTTGTAPTGFPSTVGVSSTVPTSGSVSSGVSTGVSTAASTAVSSGSSGGTVGNNPCDNADYCDDFADTTSGWDESNEADYFEGYSDFGGGSYRLGSRFAGAIYSQAPTDVTDYASDYAIRIDTDALLGPTSPTGSYLGLRCWAHDAPSGETAGFTFYYYDDSVEIALRTLKGKVVTIKKAPLRTPIAVDQPVHLVAVCLQGKKNGQPFADLAAAVNGTTVAAANYAKGGGNQAWTTGSGVGVLAGDNGAQAFIDNFGVTHVRS